MSDNGSGIDKWQRARARLKKWHGDYEGIHRAAHNLLIQGSGRGCGRAHLVADPEADTLQVQRECEWHGVDAMLYLNPCKPSTAARALASFHADESPFTTTERPCKGIPVDGWRRMVVVDMWTPTKESRREQSRLHGTIRQGLQAWIDEIDALTAWVEESRREWLLRCAE